MTTPAMRYRRERWWLGAMTVALCDLVAACGRVLDTVTQDSTGR